MSPDWKFQGSKTTGHVNKRDGLGHTRRLTSPDERLEARGSKQAGLSGEAWFDHGAAADSSRSNARKVASAFIAKISLELSMYIGNPKNYHPLRLHQRQIRQAARIPTMSRNQLRMGLRHHLPFHRSFACQTNPYTTQITSPVTKTVSMKSLTLSTALKMVCIMPT